jgi:hypothetical protein
MGVVMFQFINLILQGHHLFNLNINPISITEDALSCIVLTKPINQIIELIHCLHSLIVVAQLKSLFFIILLFVFIILFFNSMLFFII